MICRKFQFILISGFALLAFACSTDDVALENPAASISLTMIGEDLSNVFQYDYLSETNTGTQTSLTDELGITNNYLTLRQLNSTLSFFSFGNDAISLYQKDLESGAVTTFPEFYGITTERSLVWGYTNEDSVFFGLFKPFGSTNLALRVVGLPNFEAFDVSLEFAIDQLFEPLYNNGKLFVTYRSGVGDYKIVVYDTDQNSIIKTFEFGVAKPSLLITDTEDLAIFTQNATDTIVLELFDTVSFLSISRKELQLDQPFSAGPINGSLIGDKLYYQYIYQQPSQLVSGPAIFDVTTGTITVLDLLGTISNLSQEAGFEIQPLPGQYLEKEGIFAISYVLQNPTDTELGGFLLMDLEGTLLAQKNLNFVPTYFVN